jgi:hypothetical protein
MISNNPGNATCTVAARTDPESVWLLQRYLQEAATQRLIADTASSIKLHSDVAGGLSEATWKPPRVPYGLPYFTALPKVHTPRPCAHIYVVR